MNMNIAGGGLGGRTGGWFWGVVVAMGVAHGADWAQWRGPNRDDHSPDSGLLKAWPAGGPKRVWLSDQVGAGYAGTSVAGDRVYTMGLRDSEEFVIALDRETGKEVWSAPSGKRYPNNWGDGPRTTPTIDGGQVFAMGGQGLLVCLQASDGKVLWQKSLVSDLGGKIQSWGYTESPLVVGDLVLVTPGGGQGTMAALDRKSGDVKWRTKDLTDDAQYSSPILVERGGRSQVVQLVAKRFFGIDPASGAVLWQTDFPGRVAVIPTPIHREGLVYVTAGYGAGCKLVRLGDDGKSVEVVYEANKVMKNHHGGVVLVGDHVYGHSDQGWVCQEFKTGKEVWASKDLGKGAVHYADGMLYCVDEKTGDVALVEATPKGWSEKGRFRLDPLSRKRSPQGGIWPHPVVVNGRLYLRDQEYLYCYDVKGG